MSTTKIRDNSAGEAVKIGVVVVGGGPAGMMAALFAAKNGASVTLVERNGRCGRKLRITGKGRCNVTNFCTPEELIQNIPTNARFLYAAFSRFSSKDTMSFFEGEGVPLKVERGQRVFPVSDNATDIVDALVGACRKAGVKIVTGRVTSLEMSEGHITGVRTSEKHFEADAVVVCTGGKSYPLTGSDGDGYALAKQAGHTVTDIKPSLVPLTSPDPACRRMQGLSLKNVAVSVRKTDGGKTVYDDFGEMMFTHFGLTGPVILSASAYIPDVSSGKYEVCIDMKPALSEKTLDARILGDFGKYYNRDFANSLDDLLPQKMIPVIVERSGIAPEKKVNSVTREERQRLVYEIKNLRIPLNGTRSIKEAIITKGGVSVKEINPKTMESKLCRGLFFAGEVIDVDAYTGGFNLQIAFSTGAVAGQSAAEIKNEGI